MLNVDSDKLIRNKQTIQALIQIVWQNGNLAALPDFWTEDCINHAMSADNNRGLEVLHSYHQQFLVDFSAFANLQIEILQQVAEGDRVVAYLIAKGQHIKPFLDIPPTGRDVSLSTIRIDRIRDSKIAEHRSIADLAGFMQQLKS